MTTLSPKSKSIAVCIGILTIFGLAASMLTSGFQYWTFEDRRLGLAAASAVVAPPTVLVDMDGRTVEAWGARHARQVYLVDFIYTRCPSVCQVLGSEYQQMQSALQQHAGGGNIRLLSVSFDERDGKADLQAYAERHRADPGIWRIAAPATAGDGERLLRELGVVAVKDGMGGFVHNSAIHVISGDGRLIGIYPYDQWQDALAFAQRYARASARETVDAA